MTSRAATFLVEATDDLDAVRAAVRDLATQYGAPAAVVALKEDDLLVGAQLRREWRCGGPRPHDLPVFCDMAFPPTQGEVLPLGAYPPRVPAANIRYRTDIGSTFHTTGGNQ
jgi:hypothetical protein